VLLNPTIRTRTRHFRLPYRPTRDNTLVQLLVVIYEYQPLYATNEMFRYDFPPIFLETIITSNRVSEKELLRLYFCCLRASYYCEILQKQTKMGKLG
jgi:hypothetical protein